EYTYRYRNDYQVILWIRGDSQDALISDFTTTAELLNLPEKNAQDQSRAVNAVKHWLNDHTGWLLIFDNIDDMAMINSFIPSGKNGHVLLTTRAQAMGRTAQKFPLE